MTLSAAECCKGDILQADSVPLAHSHGMRRLGLSQNLPRETRFATTVPKGDICGTGPFTLAHSRDTHPYGLPQNAVGATLSQRNSVSLAEFHGSPGGRATS